MEIYIFASKSHPGISALTVDKNGENLPAEYAPWRSVNGGQGLMATNLPSDNVVAAISQNGFYLLSAKRPESRDPC